jgi:hypothetical protein
MNAIVILRCEPCGALAPLGEPRRMAAITNNTSFEARRKRDAHLQDEHNGVRSGMTPNLRNG